MRGKNPSIMSPQGSEAKRIMRITELSTPSLHVPQTRGQNKDTDKLVILKEDSNYDDTMVFKL